MAFYQNDKEMFQLMRQELFTAVVGDILDKVGCYHQFLPQNIRPLRNDMVIIGRAMPVLETDFFAEKAEGNNPISSKPFGLMFEALDDLHEDEVYIATGSSFNYALWGGLMSHRAMHLKSAGAILNGYSRDTNEILRLNFPVFSAGSYAQDQGPRGKVVDWRVPVEIEGVRITPGDIIFADIDGVLIIPASLEKEVIPMALDKVRSENEVAISIKNGMSTVDAFRKYGVM